MKIMKRTIFTLTLVILLGQGIFAQKTLTSDDRIAWWRDARFGMFIHWGVYSLPAGTWDGHQIGNIGEWIMNRGKIPVADYRTMAKNFNPVKYDPDSWVKMAKAFSNHWLILMVLTWKLE